MDTDTTTAAEETIAVVRNLTPPHGHSVNPLPETLSTPTPSQSSKGKEKARATDNDMEVNREGGVMNEPVLLVADEGDLTNDDHTNPNLEIVPEGSDSEDGEGSDHGAHEAHTPGRSNRVTATDGGATIPQNPVSSMVQEVIRSRDCSSAPHVSNSVNVSQCDRMTLIPRYIARFH